MAKTLRLHLFRAWSAEKTAVSVTKENVVSLLDKLMAESQSQNANKVRRLMHSMFAWALSRKYVRVNPVADTEAPAPEVSRTRTLTDAELVEVWNASASLSTAWQAAVRLLIVTAQRRSEVGGMHKDELQLASALWSIKPERSKNGQQDLTQLSPQAVAILAGLPEYANCPYVLTNDGQRPIGGWSKLKVALDKAILDARGAALLAAGGDPGRQSRCRLGPSTTSGGQQRQEWATLVPTRTFWSGSCITAARALGSRVSITSSSTSRSVRPPSTSGAPT